jgi:hypothetical protein
MSACSRLLSGCAHSPAAHTRDSASCSFSALIEPLAASVRQV